MKRSSAALFVVLFAGSSLFLTSACGGGGSDGNGSGQTFTEPAYFVSVDDPGASDLNPGTMAAPFAGIQAAIDAAAAAHSTAYVYVAEGSYLVSSQSGTQVVLAEGVSVYGGYASDWSARDRDAHGSVILETSASGGTYNDPNRAVEAGSGVSNATVIDGFSISANYATQGTAAVYLMDGSSPIVSNNLIDGGAADGESKGVWISGASSAVLSGNMINGGTSSISSMGVLVTSGASPVIENNDINGGTGVSGSLGVFTKNAGTSPVVRNNTIYGGTGSGSRGVRCSFDATPVIRNNTIDGGTGSFIADGIYIYTQASPTIENNIITTSGGTAGYCIHEDDTTEDPASVRNNDLFGCNTALYYNEGSSAITSITALNNLVDITISGNVSAAPAFTDEAGGDFHLSGASPVSVTQGGLDLSASFDTDKDGTARTVPWSMGAYEY